MFEMLPGIGEYALKFTGKPIGESTKMLLKEKGVILGVAELALGKPPIYLIQGVAVIRKK
jgi:hypothetical protein